MTKQLTDIQRKNMVKTAVLISKHTREDLPDEKYAIVGEPIPRTHKAHQFTRPSRHWLALKRCHMSIASECARLKT